MQCTLISSTLFERRRHVSAGVDTHEARSTHTLNISIGLARSMLHLRWREREDRVTLGALRNMRRMHRPAGGSHTGSPQPWTFCQVPN